MKPRTKPRATRAKPSAAPPGPQRFTLNLLHYGNNYYVERLPALEAELAQHPPVLQLDLIGEGEIPADFALLFRSVLAQRAPCTQLITHARSSLQNGTVLVWLQGDRRLIRDDARLFFKRATVTEEGEVEVWSDGSLNLPGAPEDIDPEDADHARLLQLINEYLPVKELAGKAVSVRELRQFGLVENEKFDDFLATVFARPQAAAEVPARAPKRVRAQGKLTAPAQSQK